MDNKTYDCDILIVGAGISGCVLAERFSNVLNKKVIVVEQRDYVGGNCHDYVDENKILIPKFGPHYFHTNIENVWKYVNNFSEWVWYEHRVLSFVDNMFVPIPVNITTVNTLFGLDLKNSQEMKAWLNKERVNFDNPKNSEEVSLSLVGPRLYEKLFKNYTKKQWGLLPSQLDPSVMRRIPVRENFDDRYFTDKYQAMPKHGYTELFKNILSSKNIEVRLGEEFKMTENRINFRDALFYSGPADRFFNYKHGKLEYRSLSFENETQQKVFFQPVAQVNYPNSELYTRITEPKHATGQKSILTTIIKEYPASDGEPYYPVLSEKNMSVYNEYREFAKKLESKRIYFIGRSATYKYINMDEAFRDALELFEKYVN